jgi:hypothetical protein
MDDTHTDREKDDSGADLPEEEAIEHTEETGARGRPRDADPLRRGSPETRIP